MLDADTATIFLVDADAVWRERTATLLARAGYDVRQTADGDAALQRARSERCDLVVVAVDLPRLDGFSLCRILRAQGPSAVMLLASSTDDVQHIAGLELGADDYLSKPISDGVFLARVRALLRRHRRPQREVLRRGLLVIDVTSRRVWRGSQELALALKAFDTLICLIRHEGEVVSSNFLRRQVWGHDNRTDTFRVYIHHLRNLIECDPSNPEYIQTVRRIGYRFQVPARDRGNSLGQDEHVTGPSK